MSGETSEAGPFPGPHGSKCFAQASKRKNFERDPVHQQRDTRGGEENCKAAANRLRKIRRVLAERIQVTPAPAHARRLSNASFETKHRPPAAFQELPSWLHIIA